MPRRSGRPTGRRTTATQSDCWSGDTRNRPSRSTPASSEAGHDPRGGADPLHAVLELGTAPPPIGAVRGPRSLLTALSGPAKADFEGCVPNLCPTSEAQPLTKNPAFAGFFESGRPDLNRGPRRPELRADPQMPNTKTLQTGRIPSANAAPRILGSCGRFRAIGHANRPCVTNQLHRLLAARLRSARVLVGLGCLTATYVPSWPSFTDD
jgi:hypothetical protein